MNRKSKRILEELKNSGLITKDSDLTAGGKTGIMFDYLINKYSYLLNDDVAKAFAKNEFKKGNFIHKVMMTFGPLFLSNPQIIEDKSKLLSNDKEMFYGESFDEPIELGSEPVIFVSNHIFKDDVLASILAANRRSYILFGSLPQFFNTLDGLLSAKNGVAMVNRKVASSRRASVSKAKYALENGMNLLIKPEGVWNKCPDKMLLDFWSGFYRIAKKDDGTFYKVVPIIHYIYDTHKPGKDNPIHTVVDKPIDMSGISEEDAVQYVRDRMATWYYKLMETYGKADRLDLISGFDDSTEAWENELNERVKTATKYDLEIETSADKRRKDDPLLVYEPVANLDVTDDNCGQVLRTRKLVKSLKRKDFQHRF